MLSLRESATDLTSDSAWQTSGAHRAKRRYSNHFPFTPAEVTGVHSKLRRRQHTTAPMYLLEASAVRMVIVGLFQNVPQKEFIPDRWRLSGMGGGDTKRARMIRNQSQRPKKEGEASARARAIPRNALDGHDNVSQQREAAALLRHLHQEGAQGFALAGQAFHQRPRVVKPGKILQVH